MDTKQLAADIEAKKLLVKSCKEQFRQAESDLALLETSLAEAEEPKLRHGDIRIWHESIKKDVSVIDLSDSRPHVIWDGGDLRNGWREDQILARSKSIGNLKEVFDDLKAMEGDLTEFTMGEGLRMNRCRAELRRIIISPDAPGNVIIDMEDLPAFILNLRRILHTAEQEPNG